MSISRDLLKHHWEIIEAFKNGAEIQYLNVNGQWIDVSRPSFGSDDSYRVKPEPKYIPFDFSDAEKIIGKAVKSKLQGFIGIISFVDESNIHIGSWSYKLKDLFEFFEFLDGTPFGKIAEQ